MTQVNVDYPFVTGPDTSTLNDGAIFADITGKRITDGGISSGNVVGPASAILNNLPVFGDTTGKLLKDNSLVRSGANQLGLGILTIATDDLYLGKNTDAVEVIDVAGTGVSPTKDFKTSRGTLASRSNSVSQDTIGLIRGFAFSGATGLWATAQIVMVIDGSVVDNQRPPSRFDFYTNAANGAQTQNASLNSAGLFTARSFGILGGAAGIDASITAANFGVKTITVAKGIITGFA